LGQEEAAPSIRLIGFDRRPAISVGRIVNWSSTMMIDSCLNLSLSHHRTVFSKRPQVTRGITD
jgi:hypothetical protein